MERVVYILGAGFSRPLGLPIMSDFFQKAKDQFAIHPDRYPNFKWIFRRIDDMALIMKYYHSDQFNIEEILSILEMHDSLAEEENTRPRFLAFIKDVIKHYSPRMAAPPSGNTSWHNYLAHDDQLRLGYILFVGNMMGLDIVDDRAHGRDLPIGLRLGCVLGKRDVRYDVITMNYDTVLETMAEHLSNSLSGDFRFARAVSAATDPAPRLAKLHGSVDGDDIVPPTWNKSLHEHIIKEWECAFNLLSEANHIRILGYSLPESDTYIKYLLKAACSRTPNLKSLDVICHDPTGAVARRYSDFIRFPNWRFFNGTTELYLGQVADFTRYGGAPSPIVLDKLEVAHETSVRIMSQPI